MTPTRRVEGVAATTQRNWLIALRAPRLGGAKLIGLLEQLGSIDALIAADRSTLMQSGLSAQSISALHRPDEATLDSDLQWLEQSGHDLIGWDSDRYPALLRNLSSPPAALFTDGNIDALWQAQIAVVGSRNPTAGGIENARSFATALAQQGLGITSGLASGIDATAHQAALESGGNTVAVTGTGLDVVYPAVNRWLSEKIRESGCLVSEFPPGTQPRRAHFPSRNRIISGLSLGVLVVEAALNSGSLITARLAAEQGREVFALPGSIHNPLSKGCHRLIREGVKLVETVNEIMEGLAPLAGQLAESLQNDPLPELVNRLDNTEVEPKMDSDPEYRKLWSCLGYDPLPIDTIIRASGLTAKAVSAMLLLLELRGKVESHPGGAYSRKEEVRK